MQNTNRRPEDGMPLVDRLKEALDGNYTSSRNAARDFISRPSMTPVSPETPKSEHRQKTLDWIKDMIAEGYTKLPYEEQYGGGGKRAEYMNIVEIIAHQDMSLAIKQGVQFGLFGMSVEMLGTEKHHEKHIPDIMTGDLLGGFAMTEIGGGSDVQGIETDAVYDHETRSFTINTPNDDARKAYIGNAALHGEMMVVFAHLKMDKDSDESMGVHAFMVPIRDKDGNTKDGINIEDCGHKVGLNGIDNGYIGFENVTVPYDSMLDRFAQIDEDGNYKSDIEKKSKRFFKMISTLVTGRIFVSMVSLSGTKNALTTAVNHAENREVFGETLMDKQATQTRLLPHLADAYAMHFMTRYMMEEYQNGNEYLETMAAAIKAKASDAAVEVVDEARLVGGADGYMSEQRYGALRNDMDVFRTFEGDNTVLRLLVARNQLTRLSKKFSKATGLQRIAKAAALNMKVLFTQFNSESGKTDHDHFLKPSYQRKIFAARERAMMYSLSSKMMKISKAKDINTAANKCQNDMLDYSDAYAERLMMQKFIKAVDAQKDPEVKDVLKMVCDLYAVHTMRKNGLWYVENGLMKSQTTKSLRRLERDLTEKLRPHAQMLTNAFDIPPEVLTCQQAKPTTPATKKQNGPRH